MSNEQARALVRRAINDEEFRARLTSAPIEEKRAILEAEGFGDIRLAHVSDALPESAGGELSDEEFAAVAGGAHTDTAILSTAFGTAFGSGSVVGVVAATLG